MVPASVITAGISRGMTTLYRQYTVEVGAVYFPYSLSYTEGKIPSYFLEIVAQREPKRCNVVHAKPSVRVFKSKTSNKNYGFGLFHGPAQFPWGGGSAMKWDIDDSIYRYVEVGNTRVSTGQYYTSISLGWGYVVSHKKNPYYPTTEDCTVHGANISVYVYVDSSRSRYEIRSGSWGLTSTQKTLLAEIIFAWHQNIYEWIPYALLDERVTRWQEQLLKAIDDLMHQFTPDWTYTYTYRETLDNVTVASSSPQDALLYSEDDFASSGISPKPYAGYWRRTFEEGAFLAALEHIPKANDNNISNIIEIVSMLKGIILDHKVEIPSRLSDIWLAYRYSYSTTKSDIDAAIGFVNREVDKLENRSFSCYGRYTHVRDDGIEVVAKCSIKVKAYELDQIQTIAKNLKRWGLSPSFYVFWDLIPYSFVVDWFIPVGDILNAEETLRTYTEEYDIYDISYSLTYDNDKAEIPCHVYARWVGEVPAGIIGSSFLESKGASSKTKTFRLLDALSLISGRF